MADLARDVSCPTCAEVALPFSITTLTRFERRSFRQIPVPSRSMTRNVQPPFPTTHLASCSSSPTTLLARTGARRMASAVGSTPRSVGVGPGWWTPDSGVRPGEGVPDGPPVEVSGGVSPGGGGVGTYGAPRVHAELARLGRRCGRKRVARLMRSQQLVGVHARRRWRRGRPDAAAAPDLVQRNFNPAGPDRLWAADVTQFRTGEGWLHLAAVIDLWSRRVVGWAMGTTANAELVSDALVMAFQRRRPHRRVVHHSDRGAAYTHHAV